MFGHRSVCFACFAERQYSDDLGSASSSEYVWPSTTNSQAPHLNVPISRSEFRERRGGRAFFIVSSSGIDLLQREEADSTKNTLERGGGIHNGQVAESLKPWLILEYLRQSCASLAASNPFNNGPHTTN